MLVRVTIGIHCFRKKCCVKTFGVEHVRYFFLWGLGFINIYVLCRARDVMVPLFPFLAIRLWKDIFFHLT
jgi:hypothetical protein